MVRISKIGPGTEIGNLILQDFKNWRKTGFKPWAMQGLGGVEHWRSRKVYQSVTRHAFRTQARNIATIALKQIPVNDILGDEEDVEDSDFSDEEDVHFESHSNKEYSTNDADSDIECDYNSDGDGDESDKQFVDGFEDVKTEELINSRDPFLIQYPNRKKLGIVFACDGDVKDTQSNVWEFSADRKELTRLRRVPRVLFNAASLIGEGKNGDDMNDFGFSDGDLMILDAAIQARFEGLERDGNGDIWEVMEKLQLPFACNPTLYDKQGKKIKHFITRRNKYGFTWGYFFLLALDQEPRPIRIGGGEMEITVDNDLP